ncbi:hypothetical protein KY360_01900 [Candidatus Woesearchaeota archaeon]|nr:hypothetical protein [Candidatus Woesearchaeota archaeon]
MADLEERLKTCSPRQRRRVAMDLAKTGIYGAIKPLARMLQGGKYWGGVRPRYYGFKARIAAARALSAFESDCRESAYEHLGAAVDWLVDVVENGTYRRQLTAIKTLGHIKGKAKGKALKYLRSLLAEYVVGEPVSEGPVLKYCNKSEEQLIQYSCKVTFPKAKRRLGKELNLTYIRRVFAVRGKTPEKDLAELARETKEVVGSEGSRLAIYPTNYLMISRPYRRIQFAIKRLQAA